MTIETDDDFATAYRICALHSDVPPIDADPMINDIFNALRSARLQGRLQGIEEAARWHDAEAERIRLLALEPRSENVYRMHEAQDDHLSHAAFIRELAKEGA